MRIPIVLLGFGSVGRSLVELLVENDGYAGEGARLTLHSVFDRKGGVCVVDHEGQAVVDAKRREGSVTALQGVRRIEMSSALEEATGGVLVDCSITDALSGEPGTAAARQALERGIPVVFASKGPLVARYQELTRIARESGARIGSSAAVGVPLPSLEVGAQGLRGAGLRRFRGVLNDSTNQFLRDLEAGLSLDRSIEQAKDAGTVEEDPSLDIDGWDAAYKLLILGRILWQPSLELDHVQTTGIRTVEPAALEQARASGRRIRVIATGEREEGGAVRLTVRPESLAAEDPLFALGPGEKGVVFETDLMGTVTVRSSQGGPLATAACVIKDVLNLTVPL